MRMLTSSAREEADPTRTPRAITSAKAPPTASGAVSLRGGGRQARHLFLGPVVTVSFHGIGHAAHAVALLVFIHLPCDWMASSMRRLE